MEKVIPNSIQLSFFNKVKTYLSSEHFWSTFLFVSFLTLYLSITVFYQFSEAANRVFIFGVATTFSQTLLDILVAYFAWQLPEDFFGPQKNKLFFVWGFICSTFADSIYGITVNVLGLVNTRGTLIELLYNIPFNLFLSGMAIFLVRLTLSKMKYFSWRTYLWVFFVALVLFSFYFSNAEINLANSQTYILALWSVASITPIITASCILLLFGTSLSAQLVSCGLLVICSANLFFQYLEFRGELVAGIPFEAAWVLGQASIFWGLNLAKRDKQSRTEFLSLNFENTRARFVISLVSLITGLHIFWQIFFSSFKTQGNVYTRLSFFIIFVSLSLMPLTLLFKTLFVIPVLRLLEIIFYSEKEDYVFPHIDQEIRKATRAILDKMVQGEKNRIQGETIARMARQVAHDIRSPLSVLSTVLQEPEGVSEKTRALAIAALRRIQEVSDDLLAKGPTIANPQSQVPAPVLSSYENCTIEEVSSIVDSLVLEKQWEFQNKNHLSIYTDFSAEAFGLFSSIQKTQMKRILSNLINNAAESISDTGIIQISLRKNATHAEISIHDNGKGIPSEIIPLLGQQGFTYGKPTGNGLGVYHAKENIKRWGGHLQIESEKEKGTRVSLFLPLQPAPLWFPKSLEIFSETTIACLDDESAVLEAWKSRFIGLNHSLQNFYSFGSSATFLEWHKKYSSKNVLFLIDFHLGQKNATGIDIIKQLGIAQNSVLVTNAYQDPLILKEWSEIGLRILPKNLIERIPIFLKPRNS